MINKKNKYNNRWTICRQGHKHQSKGEANYCDELELMKKAGKIKKFQTQTSFSIYIYDILKNKYKICNHIVDFLIENNDNSLEAHEFKGKELSLWKLKLKLFRFYFPEIKYKIIKKNTRYYVK